MPETLFGGKVRSLRRSQKLSQAELADLLQRHPMEDEKHFVRAWTAPA